MKDLPLNKVLDGGFGREISRRGLPFKRPEWSAQLIQEQPEAMTDIHMDYIKAGAQIITTNTYAIMPFHIGDEKFKEKGHQMIRIACDMAKKARDNYSEKNIQIAFSVPPLSSYTPEVFLNDRQRAKQIYSHFLETVPNFQYVDFYLCETLSTLEEAKFLIPEMEKLPKPYCLSFCVDRESGQLRIQGQSWEKLADIIQGAKKKPLAVMINCSPAEAISKNLKELRRVLPKQIAIGCYPNNFSWTQEGKVYDPSQSVGTAREDMTPQIYEKLAQQWIDLGAQIIGGCCEVGPEYMQSIVKAFEQKQ